MSGKLIVFDLDDTLYPEHQFVRSGFASVDRWLQDEHRIQGFFDAACALFESGVRGDIFNRALPGYPELIAPMLAHYRAHMPALSLHEDAAWALAYAGSRHPLGLLSDGYAQTQRNKVAALGIAPLFSALVYTDDEGREAWKPSPRPYERMMRMTGMEGHQCTYIADNPNKDFITARKLGWRTIHIRRPDGEYATPPVDPTYAADHGIETLHALEAIL